MRIDHISSSFIISYQSSSSQFIPFSTLLMWAKLSNHLKPCPTVEETLLLTESTSPSIDGSMHPETPIDGRYSSLRSILRDCNTPATRQSVSFKVPVCAGPGTPKSTRLAATRHTRLLARYDRRHRSLHPTHRVLSPTSPIPAKTRPRSESLPGHPRRLRVSLSWARASRSIRL